jgi:hypothetical protein
MWQGGGMGGGGGHGNNPWMKLMGIVHKERRHHDPNASATTLGPQPTNATSTTASNDRNLNQ